MADLHSIDNVSRETLDRLRGVEALVQKWSPKINLVSRNTLDEVWERHIEDSAQLMRYIPPKTKRLVDIGSGGGFPGLVIAAIAPESHPDMRCTFIESDLRKCVFLRQVVRDLGLSVTVLTDRIEAVEPQNADILTARALASLTDLCGFAARHLKEGGMAIFPKGRTAAAEIDEAKTRWDFELSQHRSETSPEASILCLERIRDV